MRYIYLIQHEEMFSAGPYSAGRTLSEPACFAVNVDGEADDKAEAGLMGYLQKNVRLAAGFHATDHLYNCLSLIERKAEGYLGGMADTVFTDDLFAGYGIAVGTPETDPDTDIDDTDDDFYETEVPDGLALRYVLRKEVRTGAHADTMTECFWRDRESLVVATAYQSVLTAGSFRQSIAILRKEGEDRMFKTVEVPVKTRQDEVTGEVKREYAPADVLLPGLKNWSGEDTWDALVTLYEKTRGKSFR